MSADGVITVSGTPIPSSRPPLSSATLSPQRKTWSGSCVDSTTAMPDAASAAIWCSPRS
jgi:hypothetical protein